MELEITNREKYRQKEKINIKPYTVARLADLQACNQFPLLH